MRKCISSRKKKFSTLLPTGFLFSVLTWHRRRLRPEHPRTAGHWPRLPRVAPRVQVSLDGLRRPDHAEELLQTLAHGSGRARTFCFLFHHHFVHRIATFRDGFRLFWLGRWRCVLSTFGEAGDLLHSGGHIIEESSLHTRDGLYVDFTSARYRRFRHADVSETENYATNFVESRPLTCKLGYV
jgi:hypothetical protein